MVLTLNTILIDFDIFKNGHHPFEPNLNQFQF